AAVLDRVGPGGRLAVGSHHPGPQQPHRDDQTQHLVHGDLLAGGRDSASPPGFQALCAAGWTAATPLYSQRLPWNGKALPNRVWAAWPSPLDATRCSSASPAAAWARCT